MKVKVIVDAKWALLSIQKESDTKSNRSNSIFNANFACTLCTTLNALHLFQSIEVLQAKP